MSTASSDAFIYRQPGYIQAMLSPSSLRGYAAKYKGLPKWLDYWLFGPPVIRDSTPGGMAYIFGRSEHDKDWNPNGKGKATRGFNALFLICMYICFVYVPFHRIFYDGIQPYLQTNAAPAGGTETIIDCKGVLGFGCQPGCERSGLFKCIPKA